MRTIQRKDAVTISNLYLLITSLLGSRNGSPIFSKEAGPLSTYPATLGVVLGLLHIMGKDEHLYGLLKGYITLTGFIIRSCR
jgi:hypothetical protein